MADFRQRLESFLVQGGDMPAISQLTPDASTREYFRISFPDGHTKIACVYPNSEFGLNQLRACVDVTGLFLLGGLPVARIDSADEELGIIIHEDFGDLILRDTLESGSIEEREALLRGAIAMIARIQALTPRAFELNSITSRLKFDKEKLLWELNFFKTHYFGSLKNTPLSETEEDALQKEFIEISRRLEKKAIAVCHRDFHAANLMLENGAIKVIDHQDARLGPIAYDLVSLLLDRVTSAPDEYLLKERCRYFLAEREKLGLEKTSYDEFKLEFDLMAIQRCLKAIGTFSFQKAMRGKTGYSQYIKPMFGIVLTSCKNLNSYPAMQGIISREISNS